MQPGGSDGRPPQAGPGQVGPGKVGLRQVGAAEIGVLQIGVRQRGVRQIGAAQVGLAQYAAAQIGAGQRTAAHLRLHQAAVRQIGTGQMGVVQIGAGKVGPVQIGGGEVGAADVVVHQIGGRQLDAAEHRPGQVQRRAPVDVIRLEVFAGRPVFQPVLQAVMRHLRVGAAKGKLAPAGDGVGPGARQGDVFGVGQRLLLRPKSPPYSGAAADDDGRAAVGFQRLTG